MREPGPTSGKKKLVLGIIVVAVAGVAGAYFLDPADLQNLGGGRLSYEAAAKRLTAQVEKVDWREDLVDRVAQMPLETRELEQSLPAISTFPLVVASPAGGASAEIFVSTEKSGSGSDGWMVEVANAFNAANRKVKGGRPARVRIRKIASGTGFQFIASGKYRPDAFSPSNHLWVRMAEARGVKMTPVREKTVGNIAGLVMKEEVAERLAGSRGAGGGGQPAVADIVNAVVQGDVVAGYTNPYASSTGLNFLVTVLATFSGGDEARMLAPEVASAFVEFQRNVPFVALTTLQMRESVRRDGSLDAFVMEYQTFAKTPELGSGYRFVPFGVRHDNPLYAVGDADAATREVLELFAQFMEQPKYRKLARQYGFDPDLAHDAPFAMPAGETLLAAQKFWKEKKDAGRRIAAVFVSDVSGSMRGSRLTELKRALIEGASFIAPRNAIGLVQFNSQVTVVLPIKPFGLLHRSAFHSAVQAMDADGKTAMYDGIAVALKMLLEEKQRDPEVRPMLFVLTDGETNQGLDFGDLSATVEGLQIPVYTIGFEADIAQLGRVSALVEAANLNAGEADLRYKIGSLLNAQM